MLVISFLTYARHKTFTQSSYTFTVGYHELSGTMIRLKKPLLVLKKKVAIDVAVPEFPVSSAVQLEVVGIIRQKILFKTRPKALISGTFIFFMQTSVY